MKLIVTQIGIMTTVLVVAIVVLARLSSADASTSSSSDWSNRPEPYTMTYRGQPLHCLVVEDGSRAGTIGGLTCDFNRYYGIGIH